MDGGGSSVATASLSSITPIKCALKFNPPTLILVYKEVVTGKLRRRSMPLRGFTANTEISSYVNDLKLNRNKPYVDSIPEAQLISLLNRIKVAQRQDSGFQQGSTLSSLKGLPSLSATREVHHIHLQDESEKHSIKLQDSSDVKVLPELTRTGHSLNNNFNLDIDTLLSGDESSTIHERKTSGGGKYGAFSLGNGIDSTLARRSKIDPEASGSVRNNALGTRAFEEKQTNQPTKIETKDPLSLKIPAYSPGFNSESGNLLQEEKVSEYNSSPIEELVDEEGSDSLSQNDLNKVSEEELVKKKAEMDRLFEANRLKPGDEGYIYEVEKEFGGAKIESGWDSDDSSNIEF